MLAAAIYTPKGWRSAASYDLRELYRVRLLIAENNEPGMFEGSPKHYAAVARRHPWRIVCFVPAAVFAAPEFVCLTSRWVRPQQIFPPEPDFWVCYRTVPLGLNRPTRSFLDEAVIFSPCVGPQLCSEPECYAASQVELLCFRCFWARKL